MSNHFNPLKQYHLQVYFCRSSFSDFCTRYSRDERYRGIEKMREREILFNDFLSELRRKEKDEKHHKKEQVRKNSLTNALPLKISKFHTNQHKNNIHISLL